MWELRWVLLGLGAALIVAVYLWGRGFFARVTPPRALARRWLPYRDGADGAGGPHGFEPEFDDAEAAEPGGAETGRPEAGRAAGANGRGRGRRGAEAGADADADADAAWSEALARAQRRHAELEPEPEPAARAPAPPERIVTVRFVHRQKALGAEAAILALRAAGLKHGRYGIFHREGVGGPDAPDFSVASLTEPGSFDLTHLSQKTIPGMSFFMVLPGPGDPVARFDAMVETARELARELDAELHDERGSTWSIQRERYVREELIEYRDLHARA